MCTIDGNKCPECVEALGQELDRWQLIARDALEELSDQLQLRGQSLPEWAQEAWLELATIPEMRINKNEIPR